ncbi:DMT family transporter [Spongorhabdus nitratireducens]
MSDSTRALLGVHVAVLLFGISGLFGKLLPFDSTAIVLGRTVLGAVSLGLVLLVTGQLRNTFSDRSWLVNLSIGGLLNLHWVTFFQAIQVSSVAVGLLAFSSFPVFVTFLEPLLFRERIRLFDVITAAVVILGLYLVVPVEGDGTETITGMIWGIISAFLFALLSLINRYRIRKTAALPLAFLQNTGAALIVLPFVSMADLQLMAADWPLIMMLGVFCTALPHMLFVSALSSVKAQLASLICCLEPVYGIAFAILLLQEVPSTDTLLGGSIIVGAIIYASMKRPVSNHA